MRVAIISDIHGNVRALEYFIKYINDEDIQMVLNLGDLMGGIEPIETLKMVMHDNRFINVCGNHDEDLSFIEEELSSYEISWLKKLPNKRIIKIDGRRFLMVHSRLESNKDIPLLYNEKSLNEFLNDYNGNWDFVLFGHTHYQCYLSFYEGKTMINPGSLGLSYDNRISFAIIDLNDEEVNVQFKKINYE